MKKFSLAIATLSGTIIGVGFFSLPYITLQGGLWTVLGYFLILGPIIILIHQFFGEISLATPDYKRLPGFAEIYLGKTGKNIALFSIIFGLFGSLLAYLIVGGDFLSKLFSPIFGGDNLVYTLLYFLIGAIVIYLGEKMVSKIEFWGLIGFFLILVLIFLRAQNIIDINNLVLISHISLNKDSLFLPYGPILFSLWGTSIIPELEEMLGRDKKLLRKIISIAILIPIIFYLLFIFLILGITGFQTTESALVGLQQIFGNDTIVILSFILGILTTFTSFISIGLTLRKIFWYDLKIDKNLSFLITCFVPLVLFLIGIKEFIPVISVVGGIMFGVEGILILLMYQKYIKNQALASIFKKYNFKRILTFPLLLIFFGGIIYEIVYFIK